MTEDGSISKNKKFCKKDWGKRRLQFKNERLLLPENPRKDKKCSWCNKEIGDEYIDSRGRVAKIKRMHIHHLEYHKEDPLKDTFILCPSCHLKESRRLKKLNEPPRICAICKSNKTKISIRRYKSGLENKYERWARNPLNKKEWLCMWCYNKIEWKLSQTAI